MSATPKTIQIFLPGGDPRGIRIAEITTRIVQVIEVPRSLLQDFLKMPESEQVALYFLISDAGESSDPRVYIGQTGDLRARLVSHNQNKDFWQRVLVLISRTNSLTQTHALFLEWHCLQATRRAGRYADENGNSGSKPHTPAPLEADCREIFETGSTLLATLGHPLFDPVAASSASRHDDEVFTCTSAGTDCRGLYTPEGFVVLKGSVGRRANVPSIVGTSDERFRSRLIESGVMKEVGDTVVFEKDHLFGSPSMALIALLGLYSQWVEGMEGEGRRDPRRAETQRREGRVVSLHKEINFEVEICEHLAEHGWLHAEGDAAKYDRARALFPEDVLAWVQATQPKAWEAIVKNHGTHAAETLLTRLRDSLDQRGTLDVLRHGIEMLGLRGKLPLAQFKPALGMNPEILGRYAANRLRVVRQVHYSTHSENSIDLVLFLNGLPVATVELKTDFTQSVGDAIDQYRFDRHPRPKGQAPEPLLDFPRGALVHFAVSNREVHMTTRLDGPTTRFLPFNQGDHGGKGNPLPEQGGHRTAYLWERVLERESWLEILGRYLVAERDDKKQIKAVIFPRFHQLDATRKLLAAVLAQGPGGKYLIQHSAGSGKTNSIAWSAHFLADLHTADDQKVFDTVLVVSDRNVIDTQLQEAIFDFERTTGVVAVIKGESSSKSGELATALSGGKKIVVCTIQTFPFALEAVRDLAATKGKRFAVIADEAHSSQTGEAAAKLKAVLSPEELAELGDGGEVSMDDVLAAQMAARADDTGITFVAFTATPKTKTMELFGARPDPSRPAGNDNLPTPFHVYSMRQAIEEGFILDVLQNYTTYKLAFKLASGGKELDDRAVERSAAMKGIMGWVRLHPYNIAQKVQVVVEHFRELVAPLLNGRGKAMVVVASRKEAVRWQLAIEKYIKDRGYPIRTLVAFSGEVNDPESGPDAFSEHSPALNPNLKGRDIRKAFNTDEYQILLVANKFQTGFDQPLLCGMYVDKRLAGIHAVQTLSRLNRAHPGKDTTYVLDFVNDPADVLAAFKTYYETAALSDVTDPNLVYNLKAKLDASGHYDDFEVDRVVAVEMKPDAKQSELVAAVEPVVDRLHRTYKTAQEALRVATAKQDKAGVEATQNELDALRLFQRDMAAFQRLYTYLSQIFDYGNTAVEKRAIFFKQLLRLLEFGREREGVDLSKVVLTHHTLKHQGKQPMLLSEGEPPKLEPITEAGSGAVQEKQKALLNEIIQKVNDLFEGDLTDQDKLVYVNNVIKGKLLESQKLVVQAANNTKEQFANSPDLKSEILNAVMSALEAHSAMSTQALGSETVRDGLKDVLLGPARLYETLRDQAAEKGGQR